MLAPMEFLRTPDDRFEGLPDYPFAPHYADVKAPDGTSLRLHYVDEGPRDAEPVPLVHGEPTWRVHPREPPGGVTMSDCLLRSDLDGVCTLTLNRPDKLNALDEATFEALAAQATKLESDDAIHCVVLRGAGRSFCAGNDLEDIAGGKRSADIHFRGKTVERLATLPQPMIAAIRGHCFTGGLELALAADLLVASDTARFADTHGKWALTPIWGMSQRLPRRVGLSRAKEMMFTSRTVRAEEALRISLVDRVVPDSEFDEAVAELAGAIATNSGFTNRANKRLLEATDGLSLAAGLAYERDESPGMAPDALERIRSFSTRKN